MVLSTGGVPAELYADSAVSLAPVDHDTALEMVRGVEGLAVLDGYRGAPEADVDALAQVIVVLFRLAVDRPDVLEAEVNPLLLGLAGSGVSALDALVRIARH
ncbi:acetate--CoA ligase family protein [Streptomyces xiamenensis]|uniref:Acetyl-CoA synthetase (ADP forming), alpha domain-containing protein n=1 Tax=Streptomyces xiamenensis TaxID=408015 RepID=A0A0F7FPW1_9ACTN|nr:MULTISPECIES: acetate--CoA ligase family protein [Streptomyces]AKG41434.1 acetyl-CoA synthetase (ADP forming), alpha domain-containing protein [Streptomyces xiamenensis]